MKIRGLDVIVISLTLLLLCVVIVQGTPSGADTISRLYDERSPNMTGKAVDALAGNVTALDIHSRQISKFWQGFFGNVTGDVVLQDAQNHTLYSWAVADPIGEIYAARVPSLQWNNAIQCANETIVHDEDTVFLGANQSKDADTANFTFDRTDHPPFFVGGTTGAQQNCFSTSVNSTGDASIFWEVLLYDNVTQNIIYTSILDPDNNTGFDNTQHDFQMLVADPGTGNEEYPNGLATTYYFFVEIG